MRLLRPQVSPVIYRRLVTLAGEEAQVDWGAFGTIRIGHGTRPLSGFAMVLSYSRAIFALCVPETPSACQFARLLVLRVRVREECSTAVPNSDSEWAALN